MERDALERAVREVVAEMYFVGLEWVTGDTQIGDRAADIRDILNKRTGYYPVISENDTVNTIVERILSEMNREAIANGG